MDSKKSTADVFWPNSKPGKSAPNPKTRALWDKSTKSTADILYPNHFENRVAIKMRDLMPRLAAHFGWSAEQEAVQHRVWIAAVKRECGGNVEQAERHLDLMAERLIKPASEEEAEQWRVKSNENLRAEYGDDRDRLLDIVISRRSAAEKAILNQTGLGNHPEFVRNAVETVRREEKAAALARVMADNAVEQAKGKAGSGDD